MGDGWSELIAVLIVLIGKKKGEIRRNESTRRLLRCHFRFCFFWHHTDLLQPVCSMCVAFPSHFSAVVLVIGLAPVFYIHFSFC